MGVDFKLITGPGVMNVDGCRRQNSPWMADTNRKQQTATTM